MNKKILITACAALSLVACKEVRKEYHDNGFVKLEVEYKENKPDGVTKMYDSEGNLLLKANYSEGLLDGKRIVYFPSGEVDSMETYKKGMLDGPFEYYVKAQIYDFEKKDSTEKIILSRKGSYANPRIYTEEEQFNQDIRLIRFCYEKMLPEKKVISTSTCQGTIKTYYAYGPAAGELAGEFSYDKKGRLKKLITYFGNGEKSEEFKFKYDDESVKNAEKIEYAPNGEKIIKRTCSNETDKSWSYDAAWYYIHNGMILDDGLYFSKYGDVDYEDFEFCKQENFNYQKKKKVVSSIGNGQELIQIGDQVWLSGKPTYASGDNWEEAIKFCPDGTRLPTKREYRILWNYIQKNSEIDKLTKGQFIHADKYPDKPSIRWSQEGHYLSDHFKLPTEGDLIQRLTREYQNSNPSYTQGCDERPEDEDCDLTVFERINDISYNTFDEFGFFDFDVFSPLHWTYEGSTISENLIKTSEYYTPFEYFRCVDRNCMSQEGIPLEINRRISSLSNAASARCIQAPGHAPKTKIKRKVVDMFDRDKCSEFVNITLFLQKNGVTIYSNNTFDNSYVQNASPKQLNIKEVIQQLETLTNNNLNAPDADIVNLFVENRDPAFKALIDSIYDHGYLIALNSQHSSSDKEAKKEVAYFNSLGISTVLQMEAAYTYRFCPLGFRDLGRAIFIPDENGKLRRLTDAEIKYFNPTPKPSSAYDLLKNQPTTRGALKFFSDQSRSTSAFSAFRDKATSHSGKSQFGERRGKADGGFNKGFGDGSSGIGGLLDSFGGSGGVKQTTRARAPSEQDVSMSGGDGYRNKADIMKVIKWRTPGLRHIYNKSLKTKPGFAGKVTLRFTIGPEGDIINISIASSTTGYAEFDNQIKAAVSKWDFGPVQSGNTTVTLPFSFEELP